MLALWSITKLILYVFQKYKLRQKKLRAVIQMTLRTRRRRRKSVRTKQHRFTEHLLTVGTKWSWNLRYAILEVWASSWSHRRRFATNSHQSNQKRMTSDIMDLERFEKWTLIICLYMQDIQSSWTRYNLVVPGPRMSRAQITVS